MAYRSLNSAIVQYFSFVFKIFPGDTHYAPSHNFTSVNNGASSGCFMQCVSCQKWSRGSMEFCCLRPKVPIAEVGFLVRRQLATSYLQEGLRVLSVPPVGSWGRAPAAERFSYILWSLDSLFCYLVKGKQLQKSLNLTARRVASTPLDGQKLHEQRSY